MHSFLGVLLDVRRKCETMVFTDFRRTSSRTPRRLCTLSQFLVRIHCSHGPRHGTLSWGADPSSASWSFGVAPNTIVSHFRRTPSRTPRKSSTLSQFLVRIHWKHVVMVGSLSWGADLSSATWSFGAGAQGCATATPTRQSSSSPKCVRNMPDPPRSTRGPSPGDF